METIELACEIRETRSKGRRSELRRQGRIPAVLYGPKSASTSLAINSADLRTRGSSGGGQRLIRLKSSTPELNDRHVIIKEVQRAPVKGTLLHIDFYEVDLTRPLRISVPLRFTGKAHGVAEGGILQPLVREVEVECLPLDIPEVVEVDVSPLGIHDVTHVSELAFAGNIKPIFDTDYPIVTVLPPTVEAAPVAAAAEAGEAAEGAAAPAEGAAAPAEGAAPAAAGAGGSAAGGGAKKG